MADVVVQDGRSLQARWTQRAQFWELVESSLEQARQNVLHGARPRRCDKIAFLVPTHAYTLHFASIWRSLGPERAVIVLADHDHREIDVFGTVHTFGLEVMFVEDVINSLTTFPICVSACDLAGLCEKSAYSIADVVVRQMTYGFDVSNYAPTKFNQAVDLFLCQGQTQYDECRRAFPSARWEIVGYPRLDNLTKYEASKSATRAALGITDDRPVLLWMPTHGRGAGGGAVFRYGELFEALTDEFNLILKPHFDIFLEEPDCHALQRIIDNGKIKVIAYPEDDAMLFAVADVIAADIGGTFFASIFARRNFVVLDVSSHDISAEEERLREHVPLIDAASFDRLRTLLRDPSLFQAQRVALEVERERLFVDAAPSAGANAARVLLAEWERLTAPPKDGPPTAERAPESDSVARGQGRLSFSMAREIPPPHPMNRERAALVLAAFNGALEKFRTVNDVEAFYPIIEAPPHTGDAGQRGMDCLAVNDLAGAAKAFAEALQDDPDNVTLHLRLMSVCSMMDASFLARMYYMAGVGEWKDWHVGRLALGTFYKELCSAKGVEDYLDPSLSLALRYDERMRTEAAPALGLDRLNIRFITANVVRSLGMCSGYVDAYLKAKYLGLSPERQTILAVPEREVKTPAMLRLWSRHLTIVHDRTAIRRLAPLMTVLEDRPDWEIEVDGRLVYVEDAMSIIQARWEDEGRAPLVGFSADEVARGRDMLAGLGLPADAWFVTLHMRESQFWGNLQEDEPRNVVVASYMTAIEEITRRGGWVVRLGDPSMTPLPEMDKVVDYARSDLRDEWMDLFLVSQCRFMLGSNSGPCLLAQLFQVPAILTNWTWDCGPRSRTHVCLPKILRQRSDGAILTFAETQAPGVVGTNGKIYAALGLTVEDNLAEDIADSVVEMFERLDGGDGQVSAPQDMRHERAMAALRRANPRFSMNGRFSRGWLARNFDALIGSD